MKIKRNQPNKKIKRKSAQRGSNMNKGSSGSVLEAESLPIIEGEKETMAVETPLLPELPPENPVAAPITQASMVESPSIASDLDADHPVPSNVKDSDHITDEEEGSSGDGEELELLTFFLAKEEYGIDIKMIQEITKLTDITPVPRTPSYIHGIVTLRGNVIPVFNIHDRLKLDPFIEGSKSRFVICQLKEGAAAITVDAVTDVVHLTKSQLEPPPSGISSNGSGYIKNIGRFKERLLILLDLQKALQIDSSSLS